MNYSIACGWCGCDGDKHKGGICLQCQQRYPNDQYRSYECVRIWGERFERMKLMRSFS